MLVASGAGTDVEFVVGSGGDATMQPMVARRLDEVTQRWVRVTGRPVDVSREGWLQGPIGNVESIGDLWLSGEARRIGAVMGDGDGAPVGLLPTMTRLDGPDFSSARLAAPVRQFYERTSQWRLDAWIGWSPWAWPGGWLISALFARRLQQLALPLRPLDVAHGMSSAVRPLLVDGQQVAALWLRRLRATDDVLFSGLYSVVDLEGPDRPVIRVTFPLPNGRLVVLLEASNAPNGGLLLRSEAGRWGQPGAYLVVDSGRGCWARRIPVHEVFHVHLDDEGVLRTDHRLSLGPAAALRLHYRMTEQHPLTA